MVLMALSRQLTAKVQDGPGRADVVSR